MDILDAIKTRKSVRSYLDKPIEEDKLQMVLKAARLAPSASNRQEWRFVVVRDQETRKKIAKAAGNQAFVGQAPVVIAACADTDGHLMTCGQACYPIDVAIAIEHMVLKAVEEGLGTCWVGAFYEEKTKEILGIPKNIRVVELLTLGYPAKPCRAHKDRLAFNEIVMYERWEK